MTPFRVFIAWLAMVAGSLPALGEPVALAIDTARDFRTWDAIPDDVLGTVRALSECDHATVSTVWGSVYEIETDSEIWQVPCILGSYQSSMVFALRPRDGSVDPRIMRFSVPPGYGDPQSSIMEPRVDKASGILTSVSLGRPAADCGTVQRHRLVRDGDGKPRFDLIEYRDKPECDETFVPIETFPLIFPK
ncbi:MAG: DUF1176 domain-containing protein [Pseudomonadota bacterium]